MVRSKGGVMGRDNTVNRERLWHLPQPVRDDIADQGGVDTEYRSFLICAFYTALGVLSNTFFGLYAVNVGEVQRGYILFGFSAVAVLGLGVLWLGRWYAATRHFVSLLALLLLLELFHSGGLQNTGPMYFFTFPTVALFINGRLGGSVWIFLLLALTLCMWFGVFGISMDRYSPVYVGRVIAVTVVITLLELIPAYTRNKAERELMFSRGDMERLSYADQGTQLANRNFLEKFLNVEFNRNNRYESKCCLMLVEAGYRPGMFAGKEVGIPQEQQRHLLAGILQQNLRLLDVAGVWEKNVFMVVLPETDLEGGKRLAERLMEQLRVAGQARNRMRESEPVSVSIGLASIETLSQEQVLQQVTSNLQASRRQGGGLVLG